jgi:hypothetical protein
MEHDTSSHKKGSGENFIFPRFLFYAIFLFLEHLHLNIGHFIPHERAAVNDSKSQSSS